eukprot:gb/GECH01003327.1/.p1 GENE.gb/GECH01003327.1/~~gb/GECH01003327.1/.p1  ORF type:complete len:501 (+),score=66.24 gb/GECH01003327.1/:1-1503(+)
MIVIWHFLLLLWDIFIYLCRKVFRINTHKEAPTYKANTQPPSVFNEINKQRIFEGLWKLAPGFPVNSNNISILKEPAQYLQTILDGIEQSKNRVVLASLYLGSGENEKKIVSALRGALSRGVKVHILLDCLRGTRGMGSGSSSADMLHPLVQHYPELMRVSLYHTPMHPFFKRILPERVVEGAGVQHIKAYIFDDTVLLSGANMSDWYFIDRQDRYVVFRDEPNLVSFFVQLLESLGTLCYHLEPHKDITLQPPPFDPVHNPDFSDFARCTILSAIQDTTYPLPSQPEEEQSLKNDTWVFPSIQMGPFNLSQDEEITSFILEQHDTAITLTSGYFNITPTYENILRSPPSPQSLRVITASPKANGFYGASGAAGQIPRCYAYFEEVFFHHMGKAVTMFEWFKPKWTYHAKGLWVCRDNATSSPFLTLVGSPNFGGRSVYRDLETQVALITSNSDLSHRLAQERDYLMGPTKQVNLETFSAPDRRAGLFERFVYTFFRGWL